YLGDCLVVQQSNAIPEQISSGRFEEQGALAYRKFRLGSDSQKSRRLLFDMVVMISRQLLERRPFLAGVTDELPFIFANWTARRRLCAFSELRPTLHTDEVFHEKNWSPQSASAYPAQHQLFRHGNNQR